MRVTLGLSVLLFATLAWGQTQSVIAEYPVMGLSADVHPAAIAAAPSDSSARGPPQLTFTTLPALSETRLK